MTPPASSGPSVQAYSHSPFTLLVFYNVTNKIRKRMDTAVAFTQEYYRVSYPLGNTTYGFRLSKDTHTGAGG